MSPCPEWKNWCRRIDQRHGRKRRRRTGGEAERKRGQDSGHPVGDGKEEKSLRNFLLHLTLSSFNHAVPQFVQVGDLPDAEVKPPENVLFVCKLNPVTTDEDLEIIFSRFGAIKR